MRTVSWANSLQNKHQSNEPRDGIVKTGTIVHNGVKGGGFGRWVWVADGRDGQSFGGGFKKLGRDPTQGPSRCVELFC